MAAAEVASGYVSLYARMDGSQVASEVSNALSSFKGFSAASNMLSGVGSVASKLGTALTVVGGLANIAGAKMVSSFFDTISVAENASIAFTTMRGSTKLAADAMSKLNKFAIQTPYEFGNISTAAKKLMANGVDFNRLIDESGNGILKWAGNWSAALGLTDQGYMNVLTQLGHINAAGKVYTRNITALSNNGIAAWQALADHMGISIDEVRAKVQAGEVSAEEAFAAFEEYANAHFDGTMDHMSHTMSGVLSNISDAMKVPIMGLADASGYKALTDAMYDLTDPLRELVESLTPTFNELMAQAAPLVRTLTAHVKDWAASLKGADPKVIVSGLKSLVAVLGSGPLLKGFGWLANGMGAFAAAASSGMESVVGAFTVGLPRILTANRSTFDHIRSGALVAFNQIKGGFSDLGAGMDLVSDGFFSNFATGIKQKMVAPYLAGTLRIQSSMMLLGNKVANSGVGRALSTMGGYASKAMTAITPFMDKLSILGVGASQVLKGVGTGVKVLGDGAIVAAKVGIQAFGAFATKLMGFGSVMGVVALAASAAFVAYNQLGGYLPNLGASINTTLTNLGTGAASVMASITQTMQQMVNQNQVGQFFNSLNSGIASFIASVQTQAPQFMAAFSTVFQQVVTGVLNMFVTYSPMMLSGAIQLFTGLVNGLTFVINTLTPMLPGLISNLAAVLVSNLPALMAAGVSLFTALVQAFVTVVPALLQQLPTLISTLISTLVDNFPALMNGATQLFNAIAEALPVVIPLVIQGLTQLLTQLIATFPQWGPQFLASMGNLMGQLAVAIIQSLPALLGGLASILGAVIANIPTFIQGFIDGGAQLVAGIAEGLSNFDFMEVLTSIKDAIVNGFKGLFGIASPSTVMAEQGGFVSAGLAQGMGKFDFASTLGDIKDKIVDFFQPAKDWLAEHGKEITTGLSDGIKGARDLATQAGTTVKGAATRVYDRASSFLSGAGRNITTGLSNGIRGAQALASSASTVVKGAATRVYNGAASFLTGAGRSITGGLASGISGAMGLASSASNAIKSAVSSAFSSAGNLLHGAGRSIASGLARGISSGLGWVTSAARNLANRAVSAAKKIIKWGSPSKTFITAGRSIPWGLAVGVKDLGWMAEDAVSRLSASIAEPLNDAAISAMQPDYAAGLDVSGASGGTEAHGLGTFANDVATAVTAAMGGVRVVMDPTSTASMLAPSVSKELGRLQYVGA